MTIYLHLARLIFVFLICISLTLPALVLAGNSKVALVLANDDGGVMTNMDVIPALREQLLGQFKALKKKGRKFARAEMVILSTSLGRPIWYGKISDLSTERGGEVIEKTVNDPKHCNQLGATFDAMHTTIVQLAGQGFTEIHVVVFSSLISTPVPCQDIKINLPQLPVPVDWVASLAPTSQVKSISFYAVNTHQYSRYAQALRPLRDWSEKTGHHFSIHDVEDTKNILSSHLRGIE